MAKYKVKFSCGHEEEVELFGKYADRQRRIEWYEECGECSHCRSLKEQQEQSEKTNSEVPEKLKDGKRWNKKFYGSGNIVYIDNKKVTLTDEEVVEFKKFVGIEIKDVKIPEKLKDGKRWNSRFYGDGNVVYINNEKTELTDDEVQEFKQYLKDKE